MADNSNPPPYGEPDVLAQFRGLPLSELIAAPLTAASDAQTMLARSTVDFIDTVGLNPPVKGGSGERTARQIQFSVTRPQPQANGTIREERVELGVPLLALVAPPNLQVQTVSVDFEMRIKSSTMVKQEDRIHGRTEVTDAGGPAPVPPAAPAAPSAPSPAPAPGVRPAPPAPGPGAAAAAPGAVPPGPGSPVPAPPVPPTRPKLYLHGEVASQREQTRQSDNSARIRVHIVAGQAPIPEGMSRVLDILATACAPRAITSSAPTRAGEAPGPHGALPAAGSTR